MNISMIHDNLPMMGIKWASGDSAAFMFFMNKKFTTIFFNHQS